MQIGYGDGATCVARQATPEEKPRLWPKMVAIYAPYEDYQRKTERDIPVVLLGRPSRRGVLKQPLKPQSSLRHRRSAGRSRPAGRNDLLHNS